MTYYEELGVAKTASAEEIRRAYRKLAQLLHPDLHPDEALRRICERQLARINGIAEILDDPERRRSYDLALEEPARPGPRPRKRLGAYIPAVTTATWVWVAAAFTGMALLALLFTWNAGAEDETPKAERRAADRSRAESPAIPAARPRRGQLRRPPAERAPVEASRSGEPGRAPRASLPNVAASSPVAVLRVAPQPPPQAIPEPPVEAVTLAAERSYFAGKWFFSEELARREPALYRPEMIQVSISEEDGVLRGRYRARYRVSDRPISPNVSFEFAGPAGSAETVELPWTGAGAEGEIRLKAISPVSMEVSWWATRMGALDLTSGRAILIRAEEK